jgi:hypothetical protein
MATLKAPAIPKRSLWNMFQYKDIRRPGNNSRATECSLVGFECTGADVTATSSIPTDERTLRRWTEAPLRLRDCRRDRRPWFGREMTCRGLRDQSFLNGHLLGGIRRDPFEWQVVDARREREGKPRRQYPSFDDAVFRYFVRYQRRNGLNAPVAVETRRYRFRRGESRWFHADLFDEQVRAAEQRPISSRPTD